jgi:hypothetical protein
VSPSEQDEQIRQLLRRTFQELGAESPDCWEETILVQDGFYCGRRFDCGSLHAVWLFRQERIEFYNAEGGLLREASTSVTATSSQQRQAA